MNKRRYIYIAILFASVLQGCNGAFDGLYDEALSDEEQQNGFQSAEDATRFTIRLDARSYEHWHYINLHNRTVETLPIATTLTGEWDGRSQWTYYNVHGSVYTEQRSVKVDTQRDAEEWDLAIHHFDVKTNGGTALETVYSSLDDLPATSDAFKEADFTPDEWRTNQCIVDLTNMMSYNVWYTSSMVNTVLSRWVSMDFSSPPPVYSASQRVYLLRMKDGTCAALRLVDYMSDRGTKGFLTIDVKYPY
ncbi:MAG: HmuY family protein [Prevotella sp.]|nr:HmuY family protein [Prevotella sp.]